MMLEGGMVGIPLHFSLGRSKMRARWQNSLSRRAHVRARLLGQPATTLQVEGGSRWNEGEARNFQLEVWVSPFAPGRTRTLSKLSPSCDPRSSPTWGGGD